MTRRAAQSHRVHGDNVISLLLFFVFRLHFVSKLRRLFGTLFQLRQYHGSLSTPKNACIKMERRVAKIQYYYHFSFVRIHFISFMLIIMKLTARRLLLFINCAHRTLSILDKRVNYIYICF